MLNTDCSDGCVCRAEGSIPTVRLRSVKSFLRSIGVKLLVGSEQVMRDQMEGDAARYQVGTVNGITYCRCEDIVTELKEFVKECALAGQLKRRLGAPDDALRVTVSIDKGGSYTKAFITVWDADQSQSPLRAVLLGVYSGTDDRQSIKSVFGPAMAQLERAAPNIDWPYQYPNSTNNSSSSNSTQSPRVFGPYLSDECGDCKALKARGAVQTPLRTTPYRSIHISWGGDIMVLHELLGTQGPSATYNCHVCEIHHNTLKTAKPPSPSSTTAVPAAPLRTTATATAHYQQAVAGPKSVRPPKSQEQLPLVTGEIAGCIGPSPLHVKMGLTKDLLTELQSEAAKLDERPRKERRWFAASAMQTRAVRQLRDMCLREQSLQRGQPRLHEQLEKATTKHARCVRQSMLPESQDAAAAIDRLSGQIKSNRIALEGVTAELNSAATAGPFTRALSAELLKHHIHKRSYHGGEYVGGDCDRIMNHGDAIANCLRRTQLVGVDDSTADCGDDATAAKYRRLFAALRECSQLFSAPRALCSHEIKRLEEHSAALAELWPRTFTPKFHVMTHHMPRFARDWGSIGLASEQCVESSHRLFNSLDVTFAGVTNVILKLKSMVKRFRLRARAPAYTQPKRGRYAKPAPATARPSPVVSA